MEYLFWKRWPAQKRLLVLKVCTVLSFLLIVEPGFGSPASIMADTLMEFVISPRPFDIFRFFGVLYCLSILYLIGFSYSSRRIADILVLVAVIILWIPCGILLAIMVPFHAFLNLSFLTVAVFCFFSIELFAVCRKRLRANRMSLS